MAFTVKTLIGAAVWMIMCIASTLALPATDKVPSGIVSKFDYVNSTVIGAFGGSSSPGADQVCRSTA